jgi:tetratricopeptide (TPR) repeat protein
MGESPEAVISELARAAELDPDSPLPHMTLCYIHVTILEAVDMPDACAAAQNFAPDHPDVHAMLARFHYNNANWSAALRANMRAIELDPESPNHYAFRMHLFAYDQPSDADAMRKLAARVNRDKATARSDQALEELSKLASENKVPDSERVAIAGRAAGWLEESRRLNPADASTYHYIAVARRQATGRLDPAEEESLYRYALAAQPSDINAALKLADFLHQAGRLDDAHKIYRESIHKFPGHPRPHDEYVGFLKKNADAREQFSVAMTIEFRRWALAGSVFSTEDVTDTADQLLKMGHNNDALFMFGQALSRVGIDPTRAAGQYHLGNLLHKLGRIDWATKHYVKAIKLDASASNDTNDNLLLVVSKDNEKRPPDGIHLEWPLEADLATFHTAACTVIGERTKESDKSKLKQRLIAIESRLKNQIDCRR